MRSRFANLNPQAYYQDPGSVRDALAECLRGGALSLFLGAGCSDGFGLSGWQGLIDQCLKAVGKPGLDPAVRLSGPDLAIKADVFEAACKAAGKSPLQEVHDALYRGADPYTIERMFGNPLLAAIAAMVMGSRFGCVRQVSTTNYDDVLERYLTFHGFKTQSVISSHQTLEEGDSVIYHPHGYLPYGQSANFSESIVLSNKSYNLFLRDDGWKHVMMRMMCSSVPLMVGSSGNDQIISYYLDIIEHEERLDRHTLGFICLVRPPDRIDRDLDERLLQRKLVPIHFKDKAEIPGYLFSICRKARGL